MPWRNLGTQTPNYLTWETFPQPVLGEVFRVRQSWTGYWPGTGYVQLSAIYPDAGRYGWQEIWPDRENRIFLMAPPPEFLAMGLAARNFAIRLSSRARVYAGANWTVTIEEWVNTTDLNGNPAQFVDGGTY